MKHASILLTLFLVILMHSTMAASSSGDDRLITQQAAAKTDETEVSDSLENDTMTISDPLHSFNTAMFEFNDKLYFYVLKPMAQLWKAVVPVEFRTIIKNGFHNIKFPIRFVNSLLQGKGKRASDEVFRFLINSTVGMGGLGDPAKDFNLLPSEEDFGQTLAVWGTGNGFYLVLPFFGPSTGRDTIGLIGDFALDPLSYFTILYGGLDLKVTIPLRVGEVTNETSFRIGDYEAIKEAAIAPVYDVMKDAYLQYRQKKIVE